MMVSDLFAGLATIGLLLIVALNGIEALQTLRADDDTRSIPVIAVTASAMPEDRKKILAAGFDGMQTKPIHVTEFLIAIENALMRGQTST